MVSAQLTGSGSLDGHGLTAGRAEVEVRGPASAVVKVNGRTETRTGESNRATRANGANRARLMTVDRSGTRIAGE
jgi:hypothetical protein